MGRYYSLKTPWDLVEALKLPDQEDRLIGWQSLMTRRISPLEHGAGQRGTACTRWQVGVNVSITDGE